MAAIRTAAKILLSLLDGLALRRPGLAKAGMCVIRADAIGDFVLWLDAGKGLRASYPNVRITLITASGNADLARQIPYWDAVWAIDPKRLVRDLPYRWRTLRAVRQSGFATAIQPTYSRAFLVGDSLVRATGAAERIGSCGDLSHIRPWLKRISDCWYTKLVPAGVEPTMELLRNSEFFVGLTGTHRSARVAALPEVAGLAAHLQIAQPYFVVFPGASWSGRQWPVANFARVIAEMSAHTGWVPVLCGAAHERGLCETLAAQVATKIINLAGLTSLAEFCEVVRRAKLLISNETSAVHIAATTATPSVCILGGGHFGRFMPYHEAVSGYKPHAVYEPMACFGCNWNCTQPHTPGGPTPCISAISVESVVGTAKQLCPPSDPQPTVKEA